MNLNHAVLGKSVSIDCVWDETWSGFKIKNKTKEKIHLACINHKRLISILVVDYNKTWHFGDNY